MIIVDVLVTEVFVISINMSNKKSVKQQRKGRPCWSCESIMQCFCSKEQMRVEDMLKLSDNLDGVHPKPDTVDIEEAESSLRETGGLNYEEARAVLGKYEYQKGNIEAAVRVFDGIDVSSVTPKIKLTLARIKDHPRKRSQGSPTPTMSVNSVNLLFEAMLLKAKSLQALGRYRGISSVLPSLLADAAVPRSYHDSMTNHFVDIIFCKICHI